MSINGKQLVSFGLILIGFSATADKAHIKCHVQLTNGSEKIIGHELADRRNLGQFTHSLGKGSVVMADGRTRVKVKKVVECTDKKEFILYSSRELEKNQPR